MRLAEIRDTSKPGSYASQYDELKKELFEILDAIADQREGLYNSPEFADMAATSRIILCINRLKAIAGSSWIEAKGCKTVSEREERLFSKIKKPNYRGLLVRDD